MQGRALTPDVILSGNLSISKTVNLQDKVIYHNGQYEADDGYDGLGKVTVSVHNEMTDLKATENGVYLPPEGYDGFERVDVDVPDPELDTIHITQNGRYTPPTGVYGYDDIYVDVHPNLESKTITSNGHYEPSQGKNGFSDVTVNVPERVPVIESKTITENGTYTAPTGVDGYSPITVNVPLPANAYLKKSVSGLPVPIASFSDGADAPLNSLTASIVPVQAGSGDPSPTNVRPISGRSAVNVRVVGENLYNIRESRYMSDANLQKLKSGDTLYVVTDFIATFRIFITYTGDEVETGYTIYKNSVTTITLTNTVEVLRIAETVANNIIGNRKDVKIYHNGTTTTIPFTDGQGQSVEVFGGSVDVVNGVVTPCPYYESYNGEQLTGEWISDRDVYSPNTSPTIGAQVVNIGATGTPFNTQPTSIKSLDGVNNVFASTGDVTECEYFTPVQ